MLFRSGMSDDEYRTHLTLWSMLSAPLLLGNDIRSMTPETRALLGNKDVIAIDQDALGAEGRRITQSGAIEVWTKALADGAVAMAIFNRGDSPADAEVHWEELGVFDPTAVYDLWRHVEEPAMAKAYLASVRPHGVLFLRLRP